MKTRPKVFYPNAEIYKFIIYKHNKNKSGIYKWTHIDTGKSYIGSAVNLTKRLGNYFSLKFLKKEILRNKSKITNSMLKYGYSSFSLEILEYCEIDMLITREQYYINIHNPEYNICKIAGSRLGTKHSKETMLKFKDRKFSPEALINLRKAKAGIAPSSPLRRINALLATGHITTVVNTIDNSAKIYDSMNAVAKDLKVCHGTIRNYVNKGKLLKNIYLITKKNLN